MLFPQLKIFMTQKDSNKTRTVLKSFFLLFFEFQSITRPKTGNIQKITENMSSDAKVGTDAHIEEDQLVWEILNEGKNAGLSMIDFAAKWLAHAKIPENIKTSLEDKNIYLMATDKLSGKDMVFALMPRVLFDTLMRLASNKKFSLLPCIAGAPVHGPNRHEIVAFHKTAKLEYGFPGVWIRSTVFSHWHPGAIFPVMENAETYKWKPCPCQPDELKPGVNCPTSGQLMYNVMCHALAKAAESMLKDDAPTPPGGPSSC